MSHFEYKVVPAPKKGLKGKGIKTPEARFANAMMNVMNEQATEGWEYQRSDTLPCEERSGLRGRNTTFQNMLVFRRAIVTQPEVIEAAPVETTVKTAAISADKAMEVSPEPRAPQLNAAQNDGHGAAPALGPATDAVEVKDPRAQQ